MRKGTSHPLSQEKHVVYWLEAVTQEQRTTVSVISQITAIQEIFQQTVTWIWSERIILLLFFFLECSIFINYKVLKISSLICQWTMKENTCENLLTANVTYTTMYGFCFIDTITFLNKYLAPPPPHQILLISWNFRGGLLWSFLVFL